MRAVQFDKWGPPGVLHLRTDYPKPSCKVGEVLIRIHAASINPADIAIRSGSFFPLLAKKPKVSIPPTPPPPPPPMIHTAKHNIQHLKVSSQNGLTNAMQC